MAKLVMHQRLRKRYNQMRHDGGEEVERKKQNDPRYDFEHESFLQPQRFLNPQILDFRCHLRQSLPLNAG